MRIGSSAFTVSNHRLRPSPDYSESARRSSAMPGSRRIGRGRWSKRRSSTRPPGGRVGHGVGDALARPSSCFVRSRRRGEGGQQDLVALVSEMNTRMEGMVRELPEALSARRRRAGGTAYWASSAGSIDLDEVLSRTLEAAARSRRRRALVSIQRRRQADRRHEGPLRRRGPAPGDLRPAQRPRGARDLDRLPVPGVARRRGAGAFRPGRARSRRDQIDRVHRDLQPLTHVPLRGGA